MNPAFSESGVAVATPPDYDLSMPSVELKQQRKLLLMLVGSVVVLDGVIIGLYYAFHIALRPERTQQTFVAVWVVLTLLVVTTLMKKIRRFRPPRR